MREVKFRGKRVSDGTWVVGMLSYGFSESSGYKEIGSYLTVFDLDSDSFKSYEVIPETVGQYTGLKDKNGKEIYDGDIMKRPQQNADKTPNGNHYKVVEWKIFGNNSVGFNVSAQCNKYEIIGNIYENPELLKVESEAKNEKRNCRKDLR